MNQLKTIAFVLIILANSACKKENQNTSEDITNVTVHASSSRPNILLLIADDMGKDATSGFNQGSQKPITPTLDSIRNSGISFENFWVNPTCSPTRSTIITGKYGYRTGVKKAGGVLSTSEKSLQSYISDETNNAYASAILGKWHLSGTASGSNPETFGIDYYSGLMIGAAQDYYNWPMTSDGIITTQTEYITSKITDLAINWKRTQSKPWFLWMAYTAPHTPFHVPPIGTHSQGNLPPYTNGVAPLSYYLAAVESMDFEINRLINSMTQAERENLIIIFIGDNGSPDQVAQSPYAAGKVKNSLYQGGINTPLFISGKGVTRIGSDSNLISSVDLFSTIANLAGSTSSNKNDSKSFYSLLTNIGTHRDFVYSEIDDGTDDNWTIRNGRYKLIVKTNKSEMYDLKVDPYENNNLIISTLTQEEQIAKDELEAELVLIRQ